VVKRSQTATLPSVVATTAGAPADEAGWLFELAVDAVAGAPTAGELLPDGAGAADLEQLMTDTTSEQSKRIMSLRIASSQLFHVGVITKYGPEAIFFESPDFQSLRLCGSGLRNP
jgi:hypothetical protein